MKQTLRNPVLLGFALAFIVILLNAFVSARNTLTLRENDVLVAQSQDVQHDLEAIMSTVKDAESGQRGYIITGDGRYLAPYHEAVAAMPGRLGALREHRPERFRAERLAQLERLIDTKFTELAQTIELRKVNFNAARDVVMEDRGKATMDEIRALVGGIQREETALLAEREESSRHSFVFSLGSGIGVVVLSLGVTALAYILVRRELAARQRAETEVRQARDRLEERVQQRTFELLELNTALERSNHELEQFASVASHDLQEPLRKIQAFGDRLVQRFSNILGEQGREFVERMQHSAVRMRALIDDLLAYSRVASRGKPFEPVDLNQVAEEVVSDLEGRIEQTEGRVDVGPLPTIEGDPLQMRQLFQNLIGNALKFRKPDVAPLVLVRSESGEENGAATCKLSVKDNGIGFDGAYAERIFQLFQRLHGRAEFDGTGMGLAICRKIVERHGGHIMAHSQPGCGSEFVVTLPLQGQTSEGTQDGETDQADHDLDGRR
jgi:signal transduction histidine kinase